MHFRTTVSLILVASLLSSCGGLSLGDTSTIQAQEDAIFACAKAEGDDIFPITTGITMASGTIASVQIEPTERVTPALAAKINACAAARTAATSDQPIQLVTTPEPVPVVVDTTVDTRGSFAVRTAGCPANASVLYGGSTYCTGR